MFGRYALPTDDVAPNATVTASSPVTGYEASYLVSATPSRPAQLGATTGYFDLVLPSPQTIVAAALLYHNLDGGLTEVDLMFGAGSPSDIETFIIPTHHEDGWPVSPWLEFAAPITADTIRLNFGTANSLNIQVGRLMLLTSLRDLGHDVRYGVEELEEHGIIAQETVLGVETVYDLGGKRRSFSGEFGLIDSEANELLTLHRSARGRILPWLLIPDENVNDAWIVRFEGPSSRTRDNPNHNVFPFRVRELSRGMPWP